MPLRTTRRNLACVLTLALCLFNSTLATAFVVHAAPKPNVEGEVAVIDSLVVNEQKQDSATPEDVAIIRAGTTTPIGVQLGDKLFKDDEIITGELDQVTLRFVDVQNGELNLVYVDNKSRVAIHSACLKSGRILAWVGINFRFCVGNTNLAVNGTQFVVEAENPEQPKVTVLEGEVALKPRELTVAVAVAPASGEAAAPEPPKIKAKEEAVITPSGVAKTILTEPTGQSVIDYWSKKMIKADPKQPSGPQKLFKNYKSKEDRDNAFIKARFEAIWNNDAEALETVAKVYNDWDRGDKSTEVLQLAVKRDPNLRSKYEYQATLAEADRLSGRFASAIANANEALKINPKDSRAAYIGGRAAAQASRNSTEAGRGADLQKAKQFYAIAAQNTSNESASEKAVIEQELNEVIKETADHYKHVAIAYGNPLDCTENDLETVFSGTINLPELKSKGLDVSGRARMYFVGNQFKLVSENGKVYTGSFRTLLTSRDTAVALRFDGPSVGNQSGVTVSLRGVGNCNRLRLQSLQFGNIMMTR